MANTHAPQGDKYYIPHGSPWPIFGSVTLFTVMLGAVGTMEGTGAGSLVLAVGFAMLATLFIGWCATSSRRAHELAPECGYFLHACVCVCASPGSSRPPSPSRTCRSTEAPGCAWAWTWRTWKPRCVVASEWSLLTHPRQRAL